MDQEHSESVEALKRESGEADSHESQTIREGDVVFKGSGYTGIACKEPPAGAGIVAIESQADCESELFALLRQYPPLMEQLLETLQSGRWLITMHRKVKDSPPDDLLSDSTMRNFPVEEIPLVMQGQCRAILADETRSIQRLDAQAANPRRWK